VKNKKQYGLDFVIDRLTNSIENIITGDSFQTELSLFTIEDSKNCTKKNGWNFDWKLELKDNKREVFKLTIVNNINVIQGLISLSYEVDHVFMHLLENAPFNIGKNKMYEGVMGNLVAYACKLSFQRGYDGFVSFTAKTKLITHYEETLGAFHLGNSRMILGNKPAQFLVDKYFKSK
jgi:hypothetical protein